MRVFVASIVALSLVAAVVPAAPEAQAPAPSANVKTMAGILAKLNHFPSDGEKATLNEIVKSNTATPHEKTIAQALVNAQHTATAADKPKLEAIVKDTNAPESVRTLAGILARLNHAPTAEDKAALSKLASGS